MCLLCCSGEVERPGAAYQNPIEHKFIFGQGAGSPSKTADANTVSAVFYCHCAAEKFAEDAERAALTDKKAEPALEPE